MNQKHVVVLFVIVLLFGLSGVAVNSIQEDLMVKPSPTPTPGDLIFDKLQNQQAFNSQRVPNMDSNQKPKSIKQYPHFPGVLDSSELKGKEAVVETDKGSIAFEIYPEASRSASNFIFLANDGFYNGLTFHRVEPGFVVQGGDPLGNGTGGPGYQFEDDPVTRSYTKGTVAMANAGLNTNGSQFFIMLADHPELPPNYSIFGNVISGMDVVEKLAVGDVMRKVSIKDLPAGTAQRR